MGATRRNTSRRRRARPGKPPKIEGKLAQWITSSGKTRAAVADALDVNISFLNHLCGERRRPSLELATRIERMTGGKVPASYLAQLPSHSKD